MHAGDQSFEYPMYAALAHTFTHKADNWGLLAFTPMRAFREKQKQFMPKGHIRVDVEVSAVGDFAVRFKRKQKNQETAAALVAALAAKKLEWLPMVSKSEKQVCGSLSIPHLLQVSREE